MAKIKCYTCRDIGEVGEGCSSCGLVQEKVSIVIPTDNEEVFSTDIGKGMRPKFSMIPEEYLRSSWDKALFMRSHEKLCSKALGIGEYDDISFIKYCEDLSRLRNIFLSSKLPRNSIFIIAPAGFSKVTFAYDCLKIAKSNGYSIAPILDTSELKLLLSLGTERTNYKMFGSIDYESYVMSDILFITVTKMHQREWAFEVIQQLADIRSRKDLPTIILSRYSLDVIKNYDRSNEFSPTVERVSPNSSRNFGIIKY